MLFRSSIGRIAQCFDLGAGGCLDAEVAALELVRGNDLHAYNVLVAALLNCTLDIGFKVAWVYYPQGLYYKWVSNIHDNLTLYLHDRWSTTLCIICTC